MTIHFGDQFYAARFRDVINQMVDKRVKELNPPERIGKVYSYNTGTQEAEILFPGETIENLVKVRFAKNMTPSLSMKGLFADLGYNAPSDLVRVAGKPGGYWICDYVSGRPQGADYFGNTFPINSEVKNSSWEDWQASAPRSDNNGDPTTRMTPRNWSMFWNDGSWNVEPDRDPNNVIGGGTSLKLTRKADSVATSFRVNEGDSFLVRPGSVVEIAVWAKTNQTFFSSAQLTVTFLTNEFLADPQFFASGVSAPTQSQGIGNAWRRHVYRFRVPPNHYMARVDFQANADLADGEVSFWLDEATIQSQQELITPSGTATYGSAAYGGTSWQNFGILATGTDLRGGMTCVDDINMNLGGGLKVPRDGLYDLFLVVLINAGTAAAGTFQRRALQIIRNLNTTALIEDVRDYRAGSAGRFTISGPARLTAGDILQFRVFTDVTNGYGGFSLAALSATYIPGAD